MGGGLLQLVAYGAQDAYITGNPQITFWKGLYKRHTNFAMEPFRVNFSGQVQWGTKQTAIVGRHADLLYSTYLQVELPLTSQTSGINGAIESANTYAWNNEKDSLGFNLISRIELDIGGQIIDRLYGEWLYLWSSLSKPKDQRDKLSSLISEPCKNLGPSQLTYGRGCAPDGRQLKSNILYIPLEFFFTKNPGAALPLIALQYHEVKINIYWNDVDFIAGNFTNTSQQLRIPGTTGSAIENFVTCPPISEIPPALNAAIYIDYIYLDTEERRRMAQASHEYLIEQVQFNEDKGIVGAMNRIDLTFNHPVKELVWVVQPSFYRDCRLMSAISTYERLNNTTNTFSFTETDTNGTNFVAGTRAIYTISYAPGATSYTVAVQTPGSGYIDPAAPSTLTFSGTLLGGTTPANDLVIRVSAADGSGITVVSGTPTRTNSFFTRARLTPFTYDLDPVYEQWIQINGQDRLDRRFGDYYSKVQSYQHHSGISPGGGVYSYSFALKPEENQPSGTCNFSRIDTATIVMNMAGLGTTQGGPSTSGTNPNNPDFAKTPDFENWDVRVYAVNYNILRVMSGMGGLAFSN
jgi:hypothetical protein